MDAAAQDKVTEYVKPLAVGLDGVTNYGDVERMVSAARRLAEGRADVDPTLLFLLAVFSGQEKWVARMGHRSRTEIFLGSLGVDAAIVRRLFRGLARFETDPRGPEEEIVHDAVKLESMGAYGIARGLADAYRERLDIPEMADAIEARAAGAMKTEAGEQLAGPRRAAMREFATRLRDEYRELSPSWVSVPRATP